MKREKMNKESNEEKSVTDIKEFNKIQDELISKTDGKFIKPIKPQDAKYIRKTLTRNLGLCLVFTYKHYLYSEDVKETDYFSKQTLLQYLKDYPNITRNFHHLKYWDLIQPMPTSPTEVKYKKGWYGITDNGMKFIQKEIGLPKYAFVYNDFAYEHNTNPYVMITDLINEEVLKDLLKP